MAPSARNGQYGNSKTWNSKLGQIQQKWYTIEPKLARLFPVDRVAAKRCPYVPRDFTEYVEHRTEYSGLVLEHQKLRLHTKAEDTAAMQNAASVMTRASGTRLSWNPKPMVAFNGKVLNFGVFDSSDRGIKYPEGYNPVICDPANRTAVLAMESIWVVADRHRGPWRAQADWPSYMEMKWEGSQRIATEGGKFGRFMALPRVNALPGVAWFAVPRAKEYKLDEVRRRPTEEDIIAPVDEIDDEYVAGLVNKSLLDAIDRQNEL